MKAITPEEVEGVVITIDDVMASGHCASGSRRWFHEQDLDFRKFMREGIPAAQMLATGDGLAEDVVRAKLKRMAQ